IIGGNGSILGAKALSQYKTSAGKQLNVIAVPGSIDNDIGCTSISIGTYTAVNTITEACYRLSSTASSHKRVFIIDVMGRESGYLALASFVASGGDFVLFRESGVPQKEELKTLIKKIKYDFSLSRQKHRFMIIKSENYPLESTELKNILDRAFKNTPQNIGVRITNLGHVVRGGPSTSFDRLLASRLGAASIYAIQDKKTKCLVGWIGYGTYETSSFDPGVGIWDIDQVIQETERIRKATSPYIRNRSKAYHELGKLLCQ
ncbi:MAG: 6-phosphofructokinase, partial [Deltaproteobacteria bacterium]|nr:6-phosphofructokinase [Deltaproteobacteria bacterium]